MLDKANVTAHELSAAARALLDSADVKRRVRVIQRRTLAATPLRAAVELVERAAARAVPLELPRVAYWGEPLPDDDIDEH